MEAFPIFHWFLRQNPPLFVDLIDLAPPTVAAANVGRRKLLLVHRLYRLLLPFTCKGHQRFSHTRHPPILPPMVVLLVQCCDIVPSCEII